MKMYTAYKLLLKVAILNCLVISIASFAVGGTNNWQQNRYPNVTNSYNPWLQQPKVPIAAPTTRTPSYANNWQQQQNPWMNRNNLTNQHPAYNPTNPYQSNPSYNNNNNNNNWNQQYGQHAPSYNPWMNNNQTRYNPQVNPRFAPTTLPPMPKNSNVGWGSSGFGQNSWNNPQQYPGGIPQRGNFNTNNTSWGQFGRPNTTYQHGVVVPPTPASNQNIGWGSSGSGQNNWQNPSQYPGGAVQQHNQTTGSWPGINRPAAANPWQQPSQPNPPASTNNGGNIWSGYQANGGASAGAPLAPIGGPSNPAFTSSGNPPLAPIGGSGAAQWNSGVPAGLSYPMGQPQPPNRPFDPAHPYAHLFAN